MVLDETSGSPMLVELGSRGEDVGYLGALADARGNVLRWLEWRVRDLALAWASEAERAGGAPAAWFQRWSDRWEALLAVPGSPAIDVVDRGYGAAMVVGGSSRPVSAVHGDDWSVTVDGGAGPTTVRDASEWGSASANVGVGSGEVLFNPSGAPVRLVERLPLSLEGVADAVTGLGAPASAGASSAEFLALIRAAGGGTLWHARGSVVTRLREKFAVKLRLLAGATAAVSSYVRASGEPLLNLSADSFRVGAAPASGVPLMWTFSPALVEAGAPLRLDGGGFSLGASAGGVASNRTYLPAEAWLSDKGACEFVLHEIARETPEGVELKGALLGLDRDAASMGGRLTLKLPLASGVVAVRGQIDLAESGPGRTAFASSPVRLAPEQRSALDHAIGGRTPNVAFEETPLLGPACDLYSLAVLGVRLTVCGAGRALGPSVGSLLELARSCADHDVRSAEGLAALLEAGGWASTLGPGCLTDEELGEGETRERELSAIWSRALWLLVRMVPGAVPPSFASGLGVGHHAGLGALDRAVEEASGVAGAASRLAIRDERADRELLEVVRAAIG
ncbi:MAG: hypothetical protein AAFQ71_01325 [Planctomycetota bacterium]